MTDIENVELSIKQAKANIAVYRSLQKLRKNKDFKAVIEEGYFEREAVRLVALKGNPATQNEEQQAAIVKAIDAIGALRQYLATLAYLGENSAMAIEEHEATLEELYAEEVDA